MTNTAPVSDSTLAWVFAEETNPLADGLSDPFAEPAPVPTPRRSRRVPKAVLESPAPSESHSAGEHAPGETYTFRFDVEVMFADRGKCGPKFMKQWKRVLQAQKLSPLVSPKLIPQEARFQLCVAGGGGDMATPATLVAEREQEITEELMHLRRDALPVSGEPAGTHPAGWQGVRVWMTFDRHEVEMALAKKPKI